MTKNQLIQCLREYENIEKDFHKLSTEEYALKVELRKRKTPPKLLNPGLIDLIANMFVAEILIAIIVLAVLFIYMLLNDGLLMDFPIVQLVGEWLEGGIFGYAIFALPVMSLIIAIIPSIIISIFITILQVKGSKKKNKIILSDYEARRQQITALERELKDASINTNIAYRRLQSLESKGIVHPDYLPYVSSLADYLEKGRADTLKEAINLLEQRKSDLERKSEERQYRREMVKKTDEIAVELSRVADAAEHTANSVDEAAFWGAATTFIVANEVDRQRRKE